MGYIQKGYCGVSMSVNASIAYDNGEKPITKWNKTNIIDEMIKTDSSIEVHREMLSKLNLTVLKATFLCRSSWHHTGSFYNETDFYSIDEEKIEEFSISEVEELIKKQKENRTKIKSEKKPNLFLASYVEYTHWYGTRRYPKSCIERDVVFHRSNEKMVHTKNGVKRLSSVKILKQVSQKTKYPDEKRFVNKYV